MALNLTKLKEAVQEKLAAEAILVQYTGHGNTDPRTDLTDIRIMESEPNFPADNGQYVTFDVITTEPLFPDAPTSKCHRSTILIYGIGPSSDTAGVLTDEIQSLFEEPGGDGYYNFTNSHVLVHNTLYRGRLSFGNKGNKSDTDNDTWVDGVEIEVTWCSFNCSGDTTASTEPQDCEPEDDDLEYDCC